jgi:hypothetical protein
MAFARKPYKLRAPVLGIVDEFHDPLGRELIRQSLHALTTGGRISAICGTVSGPSSARLRMKPNAPPPQLVMSPAF